MQTQCIYIFIFTSHIKLEKIHQLLVLFHFYIGTFSTATLEVLLYGVSFYCFRVCPVFFLSFGRGSATATVKVLALEEKAHSFFVTTILIVFVVIVLALLDLGLLKKRSVINQMSQICRTAKKTFITKPTSEDDCRPVHGAN